MDNFLIGGFNVTASNREEAERIKKISDLHQDERLLIIESGGLTQVVVLSNEKPTKVFTKSGKTISYCGEIQAGSGYKLLQTAIDSVNIGAKESAKLSSAVKKLRRETRHKDESKIIADFEGTVPDIAKALFTDVMNRLDALTVAYKLEIIDGLQEKSVVVKEHNWIPILTWFRDNVLSEEEKLAVTNRRTFFQLRKAFVTTIARMAGDDVRHANTMKLVKKDDRGNDFWTKYGEEKR